MAFNFSEIIAQETQKQKEAEMQGNSSGGIGYKTVYPFLNGRLEFKFIGNEPSGLLYRELHFHEYYSDGKKQKVPCLKHMYGIDCPICNMADKVYNDYGDSEVYKKYGVKKQGIMFAKLLGFSEGYFKDNQNPPKINDIVLFMFPKSVINELRNLIIEFSEEIDTLFTNNTTRNITLKVGTQANGFPEYTFYVKNTTNTLIVDNNGNPDDAAFNAFMINMPNLKDIKFSKEPSDTYMNIHKTIVDEMTRKYYRSDSYKDSFKSAAPMGTYNPEVKINNVSVQPMVNNYPIEENDTSINMVNTTKNNVVNSEPIMNVSNTVENSNAEVTNSKGQRPPCFGNNEYNDKCAACPFDNECV